MNTIYSSNILSLTLIGLSSFSLSGCSHTPKWLGIQQSESHHPISNPFDGSLEGQKADHSQTMILRTKKGDRSVEFEIPEDSSHLSEFSMPVSSSFKDRRRGPASTNNEDGNLNFETEYKEHAPTFSDREIAQSHAKGSEADEQEKQEIEEGLYLKSSSDLEAPENSVSYLARVDHIKQLYKSARYEVALLESDELIKEFPFDPKLYEMRGTLLDRIGRKELAVKAWNQSLRLDPKNEGLRKFLSHKQQSPLTAVAP